MKEVNISHWFKFFQPNLLELWFCKLLLHRQKLFYFLGPSPAMLAICPLLAEDDSQACSLGPPNLESRSGGTTHSLKAQPSINYLSKDLWVGARFFLLNSLSILPTGVSDAVAAWFHGCRAWGGTLYPTHAIVCHCQYLDALQKSWEWSSIHRGSYIE